MNIKTPFVTVAAAVLFGSLFITVVKPALMEASDRPEDGFSLKIDYGIPTKWFRRDDVEVPAGSPLPKNSVGLDFICIDTAVRTDGINTAAYEPRYRGDPFYRPFRLPPLHLALFRWTAFLESRQAIGLWGVAVLCLVFLNSFFWFSWVRRWIGENSRKDGWHPALAFLFAAFFTVSYPAVFQFERGQTDVVVLTLISLCGYFFCRRRWFWLGVTAAAASLFKVYPVFFLASCFVLGLLAAAGKAGGPSGGVRNGGIRLIAGQIAGFSALWALMFPQHLHYFTKILIPYARADEMPPESFFYHSLHASFGTPGIAVWIAVWIFLTTGLAVACRREFRAGIRDGIMTGPIVLFFTLLVSWTVFIAKTSYDYNLILLIPLFSALIAGGLGDSDRWAKFGGSLALLGFALPRWIQDVVFPGLSPFSLFLFFLVGGIILVGISAFLACLKSERPDPGLTV